MKKKKILFDIGHPAHVHLFKNAIKKLNSNDIKTIVLARDKEVTYSLLNYEKIYYIKGTKKQIGIKSILELIKWFFIAFFIIHKHKISLVVSIGSPASCWASMLSGIKSIVFNDTETATIQRLLYKNSANKIYVPKCLTKKLSYKQETYDGIHELSYLSPYYFSKKCDPKKVLSLGNNDKYIIIRLISWDASHDWGKNKTKFDDIRFIINKLKMHFSIFISNEGQIAEEYLDYRLKVHPIYFHDILKNAEFVISDGSTSAIEAAILGTPSIYISSFANELGVIKLLMEYNLIFVYQNANEFRDKVDYLISNYMQFKSKMKLEKFFKDRIDVSNYIYLKCLENLNSKAYEK